MFKNLRLTIFSLCMLSLVRAKKGPEYGSNKQQREMPMI
jgi:hypothetical protein